MAYAPLDGLVIAGFKMEPIHPGQRAPMTTVSNLSCWIKPNESASHGLSRALCDHQKPMVWLLLTDFVEKGLVEVRRMAMFQVSLGIAVSQQLPLLSGGLAGQDPAKAHARFRDLSACLTDLFTLFLLKSRQKIVEIKVGPGLTVVPVKLQVVTSNPALGFACGEVLFVSKQKVQRGQAQRLCVLHQGSHQRETVGTVLRQKTNTGHGGEGHCHQTLRVIGQAPASMGLGPRPIENVLTS